MHYLPESNLLNPAVPISCKWYIGLPVLSSVHVNYANSSFSYNTLFNSTNSGNYELDLDRTTRNLHWRNYIGTEIHLQLFALGYRKNDYSFIFTITEKNNLPITYPKEVILLALQGNSQFEGKQAGLQGTGIFLNHYREYALGMSKSTGDGAYFGIRGKLLFGKLNLSTKKTDIGLTTDETTFDLTFQGDLLWNSSLPILGNNASTQNFDVNYNDAISPMELALNRKNPGFAIDAGIIYPVGENLEISASIIDLGLIRWRSNLNTFEGSGTFLYTGPLGDSIPSETYFNDLVNSFTDSMNFDVRQEKYTSFLPPRILAGANYQLNDAFSVGLSGNAIFHRTKVIPAISLIGQYSPNQSFHFMASYTIQYYNLNSVGFGFVLGRNPLQFYMISDNVTGMIWPMSARNINLRMGLNLNFGCKSNENGGSGKGMLQGNCYWLEKSIQKNYKKQKRK